MADRRGYVPLLVTKMDQLRNGAGLNPHYPRQVIHAGYTVLVTRVDGALSGEGREGLYDFDTRILSRYRLTVDGEPLDHGIGAVVGHDRWIGHQIRRRKKGSAEGPVLPQDALEIVTTRLVGRGMLEQVTARNHGMTAIDAAIAIELDADFADLLTIGNGPEPQGETEVRWDGADQSACFDHHGHHDDRVFHRALRVRVSVTPSRVRGHGKLLEFQLRLPARGTWAVELRFESLVDGAWRTSTPAPVAVPPANDRTPSEERRRFPRLISSSPVLDAAFAGAAADLQALRNHDLEESEGHWVLNAGVPTYTGIFGRDSLTAGWQAAMLGPELMLGALATLAAHQATKDVPWRDEEPGKLLHEARRGPLADLDLRPHRAYYGEQTAPALFVLCLSEYWHWTGDEEVLRRYGDSALRAMEWAERYGDADGDYLLEYAKRSPAGLANHGWKDSDEAIRYPDGSLVRTPISTIEEQAFYYIALGRMAEILTAQGEDEGADRFIQRARALRRRVNETFWSDSQQFYAMALDPDKRPVLTIGSNAGHALAAGIVPDHLARVLADRLLAADLYSGWGVRTLSADHPSYNPLSYHLGSVWPVENSTFALGCKRYGLDEHAERLLTGMIEASAHFEQHRLPEALTGHSRDDPGIPMPYPGSNSPQAWSASAVIQLVQVMLGLYPFAPANTLTLVRPRLPPWLSRVDLENLRVGDATVSLRFERGSDGRTTHSVYHRRGKLRVVRTSPPVDLWPEQARARDRFAISLLRRAPGRLARALRLALGWDL